MRWFNLLFYCCLLSVISYLSSTSASAQTSTPYGGIPQAIPGIIELENYDEGGQNVAYYDTTTANEGGMYRTGGVDIGDLPEEGAGGNYSVGWLLNTEWLKYTVNVSQTGPYELKIRGGLPDYQASNPARFQIKVNDQYITGNATSSTFELDQNRVIDIRDYFLFLPQFTHIFDYNYIVMFFGQSL